MPVIPNVLCVLCVLCVVDSFSVVRLCVYSLCLVVSAWFLAIQHSGCVGKSQWHFCVSSSYLLAFE